MLDYPTSSGPNHACAQGLRQVADWLEDHPELPPVRYCPVILRSEFDASPDARAELELVAAALGARASESLHGNAVTITGEFAPQRQVTVQARARLEDLIDPPPVAPAYEPIIPREYSLKHPVAA